MFPFWYYFVPEMSVQAGNMAMKEMSMQAGNMAMKEMSVQAGHMAMKEMSVQAGHMAKTKLYPIIIDCQNFLCPLNEDVTMCHLPVMFFPYPSLLTTHYTCA